MSQVDWNSVGAAIGVLATVIVAAWTTYKRVKNGGKDGPNGP